MRGCGCVKPVILNRRVDWVICPVSGDIGWGGGGGGDSGGVVDGKESGVLEGASSLFP